MRRGPNCGRSIIGISSSTKPVRQARAQFHGSCRSPLVLLAPTYLANSPAYSPARCLLISAASHVWIQHLSFRLLACLDGSFSGPVFGRLRSNAERLRSAGVGHFSTVVIDAGHGGKDSGGVSGRRAPIFLREKDLTLDTAKRVRDELRRAGLRTVMMRDDDHFVELDDRVSFANRQGPGAVLVSIHYDAVSSQAIARSENLFLESRQSRFGNAHSTATRRGHGRNGSWV